MFRLSVVRRVGAVAVAIVLGTTTAWALTAKQEAKLLASDGAAHDRFGVGVAIDGDTAVIGAHLDDDIDLDSGSAYVFTRTEEVWTEQAKLLPADGARHDHFGWHVAIDGDTAVIGAPEDDDNGQSSGSAYVFTRTGDVWSEQAKLLPADGAASDHFGGDVALDGDTVVIGANGDDDNGSGSGSAYVFTRTGDVWTEQAKLLAADDAGGFFGDKFGSSVAIDGDTAVIGANGDNDNGNESGSAYVFTRTEDVWTEQAELLPADGAEHDRFGGDVALDGDTAVIGAMWNDDNGLDSGSAYVFTRTGDVWSEQAKLLPADGAASDRFGDAVALDGDTAAVGAYWDHPNGDKPGSAYVFRLLPFCGDGILDPFEDCDDGNNADGDGCDSNCTPTACGNGIVTEGEECDDSNNEDGDGCQGNCLLPVCGDGILDPFEDCDDGNNVDGDGCAADCILEEPVPAASNLALLVLVLLLLTITTAVLRWRRRSEV